MLKRSAFMTCFVMCGNPLFAQITDSAYTLVPQTATAGLAFSLTLKNPQFSCATRFSNLSVSRSAVALHLGFEAVADRSANCPASDSLFGPTFSIPPLTTGMDSVYADQQPACAPICQAIAIVPQFAGILNVKSPGNDSTWFIHPMQVAADIHFTLQLLNYAYDNCQTSFTHDSLDINGSSIDAFFVASSHPDSFCTPDTLPYGPSYPVSGLSMGKYPVYAVQRYACEYTPPYCPPALIYQLVDTLDVTPTSSLFQRSNRGATPLSPSVNLEVIQGYRIDGSRYKPMESVPVPNSTLMKNNP